LHPPTSSSILSFKSKIGQLRRISSRDDAIRPGLGSFGHVKNKDVRSLAHELAWHGWAEVRCGSSSTRQVCTCKQSRVCLSLACSCPPSLQYLYSAPIELLVAKLYTCIRTLIKSNPSVSRMDDLKAIQVHPYAEHYMNCTS
jgi:hypothetical protein